MKLLVPSWASRAVACLILLVVLVLVKLLAVDPLVDAYAASADEVQKLAALSARYQALAARLPALKAERDGLARRMTADSGFLENTNETLAAADLQARLKTLVDQAHGELKSTQILPVQQVQGFRRVGVRAEMSMTLPALQKVLYETEAGSPTLVLDDLSIRSKAADRQEERNPDVVLLTASVDIYGFLKGAQ
jgi:general secretion pathway protein M